MSWADNKQKAIERQSAILKLLKNNPAGLTAPQVFRSIDFPDQAIAQKHLHLLMRKGKVIRIGETRPFKWKLIESE